MRMILATAIACAASIASAPVAIAGTPVANTLTCPIGGETFTFFTTLSSSTWGARPDGKPYGSWENPKPVAACPGNGLVMYRRFSDEDIARLTTLIATAEFQAIKNHPTYYRMAWLMRALGEGEPRSLVWIINQASWQSDNNKARKAAIQREFAEGVAALPREPDRLGWIALQARSANAWREVGDFERAEQAIAAIPIQSVDVTIPEKVLTEQTADGAGQTVANAADIELAQNKRNWLEYLTDLKKLVEQRDSSSEPLEMIPVRQAASRCMNMEKAGSILPPHCSSDPVKRQIAAFERIEALLKPR